MSPGAREGAAGDDEHPVPDARLDELLVGPPRDAGVGEEGPLRPDEPEGGVEGGDDPVALGPVGGQDRRQIDIERGQRRLLGDGRGVDERELLERRHLLENRARTGRVADPPPHHGVRLRERPDGDDAVEVPGDRLVGEVVAVPVVHLVGEDEEAALPGDGGDRPHLVGRVGGPRRVDGVIEDQDLGARRDRPLDPLRGQAEVRGGVDEHGGPVAELRKKLVEGEVRLGDQHLVPRVHEGGAGQEQPAGGPGCDERIAGVGAGAALQVLPDPIPQFGDPLGDGVPVGPLADRPDRRLPDRLRRREMRLAEAEVDHPLHRLDEVEHLPDARDLDVVQALRKEMLDHAAEP